MSVEVDRGARARIGLLNVLRVREFAIALVIAISALVLGQVTPYFLTTGNLRSILVGLVTSGLITVGQVLVLIAGGLDLSVGSVMAFSGTLVGLLMQNGVTPGVASVAVLVVGSLVGLGNGFIVTRFGVSPLIATLGMMTVARGASLVLTEGYSVTGLPTQFRYLGQGELFGMPPMVWLMLVLVVVLDVALRMTSALRQVYYVGGNERAAVLSGIRVDRVKEATYAVSGFLAALAGVLLASRLMAGTPTAGSGLELTSIAAAVIGGASLLGGEGTVLGAFLGALFMAIVSNATVIMGVSIYWQGIVTGVILVLVVTFDVWLRRRQRS